MIRILKEGDRVPDSGYLVMRWHHSYFQEDRPGYMVLNLSGRIGGRNPTYETREEAIMALEASGKENIYEVPFEAELASLIDTRILVRWEWGGVFPVHFL